MKITVPILLALLLLASCAAPLAEQKEPVRLTVIGVSQMFAYFQRTQDRILDFVTEHSHVRREDFLRLMLETGELAADVGSVVYGQEAVDLGLIDQVGGLWEALDHLHQQISACKAEKEPGPS